MTTKPLSLLAAGAVAGALTLTACGDDDSIAKEDFIEEANAICTVTNAELEPIFEEVWDFDEDLDFDDPANQNVLHVRFHEAMQQVEPIALQQLDDIRALGFPDGDEELLGTLLDDQEAAIRDFAGLTEAAAGGDHAAMAALDGDEDPFGHLDRRAREYGLTVCGESG